MGVSIAEYLGQRTDVKFPLISPVTPGTNPQCPFMALPCIKIAKKLKPICSVRKQNGELWIVCKDRLCSTTKKVMLTDYQKEILLSVGRIIYSAKVGMDNILIKREASIPVVEKSIYHADYVMMVRNLSRQTAGPKNVVLEMQGGGETSNTGKITAHVKDWEQMQQPTNEKLSVNISSAGVIETNAWRRQQEQFLTKGNIVCQTGGAIVFCVGSLLYTYLARRLERSQLNDLQEHNWTLCLICFEEDRSLSPVAGPIPLTINRERLLFTNYVSFVQVLTNQGQPNPGMFVGPFESLSGETVLINPT